MAGLEKLKNHDFKKKGCGYLGRRFTNEDIQFDSKWNLLPFKNGVYDLETHIFREHRYDDYISITTGYDWVEPSQQEVNTIERFIKQIIPA